MTLCDDVVWCFILCIYLFFLLLEFLLNQLDDFYFTHICHSLYLHKIQSVGKTAEQHPGSSESYLEHLEMHKSNQLTSPEGFVMTSNVNSLPPSIT